MYFSNFGNYVEWGNALVADRRSCLDDLTSFMFEMCILPRALISYTVVNKFCGCVHLLRDLIFLYKWRGDVILIAYFRAILIASKIYVILKCKCCLAYWTFYVHVPVTCVHESSLNIFLKRKNIISLHFKFLSYFYLLLWVSTSIWLNNEKRRTFVREYWKFSMLQGLKEQR